MRTVFGALFLLLAGALVLMTSQLYLRSLPAPAVTGESLERCRDVIGAWPALLMFTLTCGAIALSHLPWRDKAFQPLRAVWGSVFFLFAVVLLYVQLTVFQEHECEPRIGLAPALLLTLLALVCLILALSWAGGRALASAFLLISIGLIGALAFSLLSHRLELSPYGYFTQVLNTILLTAVGAAKIGSGSPAETRPPAARADHLPPGGGPPEQSSRSH